MCWRCWMFHVCTVHLIMSMNNEEKKLVPVSKNHQGVLEKRLRDFITCCNFPWKCLMTESALFFLSLCSKNILRMDFSVVLLVSIATQSMVADRFFVSSVLLRCFHAITPFHLVCIEFFSKITSTYVYLNFCANTLKWSYLLHCWNEQKHLETQRNSAEQKKRAMVDISCKQKGKTTAAV